VRHSNFIRPALEGRTLLDELNHRIKNVLASIINLISFNAVWADNVEAKEALSNLPVRANFGLDVSIIKLYRIV
jgi:two-component sensor histidine kinase